MQQLAFGRSYYFREQARMLEALTSVLWDQWQQALGQDAPALAASTTREQLAHVETARLSAHATWETVDPVELLEQLRTLIEALAQAQGVAVQFKLPQRLTLLRADRVLLRQAMLNVIVYALDSACGGMVEVSSFVEGLTTGIRVLSAVPAAPQAVTPQRQGVGLDVCRRFMAAMGGALEVQGGAGARWEARLVWPTSAPRTLLVIDDNQDFADLFRRYLAGHNWQVIGAADGAAARQILAELVPTVITLDVMIPREDGWELLAGLRASERTRTTPIIVCSVLNEPRLARTLGATAYLPKPVTQPALLDALAPWGQAGASLGPAR
jgi:CheY-like chemotaxis protein